MLSNLITSERVWDKEEMLGCIDYLSVEELKAFIPRLLATLKVIYCLNIFIRRVCISGRKPFPTPSTFANFIPPSTLHSVADPTISLRQDPGFTVQFYRDPVPGPSSTTEFLRLVSSCR
jgi:hypothetical protein